jgi:hypothetical protein
LAKHQGIPREAVAAWAEKFNADEKPFIYHRIPHVLYKGELDTTQIEIITI